MFLSDEEIVLLFRDKNRRSYAFTQLLEKYKEKVYWLIRRMVQNHEDANDLTQEVFIKIWRKLMISGRIQTFHMDLQNFCEYDHQLFKQKQYKSILT
jgi:RNA polymerase sigma factor (sigma-70 family)